MLQTPPIVITRIDLTRLRRLLASPTRRDSDAAEALADEIDRAEVIDRQLARLVAPDQMGELFKAACIHSEDVIPPGFEIQE